MDVYPPDYVDHNLPLVLLSGLEPKSQESQTPPSETTYPGLKEHGIHIFSDFPPLVDATAEKLLAKLLAEDASLAPWNIRSYGSKTGGVGFRVKHAGRTFTLPPHKAQPPTPSSPSSDMTGNASTSASLILHSPVSPLTPSSPTYPDGLMTPLWVTKHQSLIPAAFVNFFPFTLDSTMASLRDNQLKIEINSLRKDWAVSGYKTKFVVALICEDGPLPGDANDRISSIRRATNLDPKSVFVLPPNPSLMDLSDFVKSLFNSLQVSCVEHYRDLSKHTRRKRNRGAIPPPTVPPTTGTSQTLAAQGWNIRYEFKLGVFAEFRQEMDAACRSYETAYELLFGEEVFETIAGWSSRFNDARILADVLAIRIIRCLLWSEQTSLAARTWWAHKRRIASIVDRRGKGTKNYGWKAWEARWSLVMAELIRRADPTSLSIPDDMEQISRNLLQTIYASPEKALSANQKLYPWELLHHEGYWLNQAAVHTVRRRQLAEKIPDEDRTGSNEASSTPPKTRTHIYDTYLAPEPYDEYPLSETAGTTHSRLILEYLNASSREFSKRGQMRMVESQKLDIAREYMRLGEWPLAADVLRFIWPSLTWRRDGWWHLMEEFGWALRECAWQTQDVETLLKVDWELMNSCFTPKPGWDYNLRAITRDLSATAAKPSVLLKEGEVVSCLSASFVFEKSQGNVGEPLQSQLVVRSCAHKGSAPISLNEVKIVFEGSLRPVRLLAKSDVELVLDNRTEISHVTLTESLLSDSVSVQSHASGLSSMTGTANLTFSPGQTRVFNLTCIPREAGEVNLTSITLIIEDEGFDIAYVTSGLSSGFPVWWNPSKKEPMWKRIGKDRDTASCTILPKPPKIIITTPTIRNHYYTDEQMVIDILIENQEDETADLSIEVRLLGQSETSAQIQWVDEFEPNASSKRSSVVFPSDDASALTPAMRRNIGALEPTGQRRLSVLFTNTSIPLDYEVEISALYHLVSDADTPIFKTVTLDLSFIRPFEANYELLPRVHPAAWPDFFHHEESGTADLAEPQAQGLQQRWNLNSKIISFAHEPLLIEEVTVAVAGITGGVVRHVSPEHRADSETPEILPEQYRESDFTLELQRMALEDRQPTTLNLVLEITWRRQAQEGEGKASSTSAFPITRLPVPRFVVPMGEPRVLAAATPSSTRPDFIQLDYTLENPSMHFLTFNLNMEASDQFAFSGPKTTAVQLVPLSRHTVRYHLLSTTKEKWIQPQFLVVDSYYNKTLRVLPTEGMKADKKGILICTT